MFILIRPAGALNCRQRAEDTVAAFGGRAREASGPTPEGTGGGTGVSPGHPFSAVGLRCTPGAAMEGGPQTIGQVSGACLIGVAV